MIPPANVLHGGLPPPYPGTTVMYNLPQNVDTVQTVPYPPVQLGGAGNVVYPRQQMQYYYPGQVIQSPYGPGTGKIL